LRISNFGAHHYLGDPQKFAIFEIRNLLSLRCQPRGDLSMFTKRDALVALLTMGATFSIIALGQSAKPFMPSSIFEWTTIEAKPTKVGARRDFFQSATATLDELECHVTTVNPGESPHAPHQHADEELIIVKEGTVEILSNGKTIPASPGSVIFHATNQLHGLRNIGKTPASYYVIRWKSPGTLREKTK
jgi:mannose-6-phosphate isomerase-like protein (cupin superfamily)